VVRQSIADFVTDDKALASLRAGVQKMRELDPKHPFSWTFQANVHWRPLFPVYVYEQADAAEDPGARLFRDDPGFVPEPNVFNQCPHGNWWFLPWHRAYLHFFERILRWASGNPALALHYWNYCDPRQREFPTAFREPKVQGQPNPLYLPDGVTFRDKAGGPQVFPLRNGPLNRGQTELSASAVAREALRVIPFTTSAPSPAGQGFGSPRACDVTCACGAGAVENSPHNVIHDIIGGQSVTAGGALRPGFMGDVPTAARDPIFWLHHANIDRLWESWLALKGGRKNPEDPDWLDASFSFFDVKDGRPELVKVTPRALLNTQELGYRYADLETLPEPLASRAAPTAPGAVPSFVPLAATSPPGRSMPKPGEHPPPEGAHGGIQLKNTAATTVALPLEAGVTPERFRAPAAVKAEEKGELVLSLEGIAFDRPPGVYYEVYLNLPTGEKATPESAHHVGSLSFFGLGHHHGDRGHGAAGAPLNVRFAVPESLRKLIEEGKVDPKDLKVTFTPETGTQPIKKDVEVKPPAARTAATVRQVRLMLVR
jgi:hypothetical protein